MGAIARRPRSPEQQLALFEPDTPPAPPRQPAPRRRKPLCGVCREKEARYGFRNEDLLDRPGTLCFECFRLEVARRQDAAESRRRLAASRNQSIAGTLEDARRRRGRAQIAARKSLADTR